MWVISTLPFTEWHTQPEQKITCADEDNNHINVIVIVDLYTDATLSDLKYTINYVGMLQNIVGQW